jgi:hypothetical protein
MSLTRRCLFQRSLAVVAGIGLAGTEARAQSAKMAQNLVGYQGSAEDGQDCKGCKLFTAPSACQVVDGPISPNGWCKMWIKA